MSHRARDIKERINKWDLIKIKSLALAAVAQWTKYGLRTKRSPVQFPVRAHAWEDVAAWND